MGSIHVHSALEPDEYSRERVGEISLLHSAYSGTAGCPRTPYRDGVARENRDARARRGAGARRDILETLYIVISDKAVYGFMK